MKLDLKTCALLAALVLSPALAPAEVPEGQPAPQVSMKLLDDGAVSDFPGWEAYKGKVVVLEFWATWCEGCVDALPHLNALAAAFRGKPVEFISVTGERAGTVKKFLETHTMAGSVAFGGNAASRAFGAIKMPQTVIVGKSGAVLRYTSPGQLSEEALQRLLDSGSAEGIASVNNTPAEYPEAAVEDLRIFEVRVTTASNEGGSKSGRGSKDGEITLDLGGVSLRQVLAQAYDTTEQKVEVSSGFPQQKFNFSVQVPRDSADMLQPFLLQAIRAAYRAEVRKTSKERQVLLLRCDKAAQHAGLSPSKGGHSLEINTGQVIRGKGATVEDVRGLAESAYDMPVIDETGLTGIYDIDMEWKPRDNDSLKAALKDRLGMTLVPASRVIDVVEAVPADAF